MCIADGVSGWKMFGINASAFSNELVSLTQKEVCKMSNNSGAIYPI